MIPIKKIITGFALTFCFAISTFAANVTTITLKINKIYPLIEQMVLYEYESIVKSKNYRFARGTVKELNGFKYILLEDKKKEIINLQQFIDEFILISSELKEKVWLECRDGYYQWDYKKQVIKSRATDYTLVAQKFNDLITEIYDYLKNGNIFSKKEYYDFEAGLRSKLLSEKNKKLLFNSLRKCYLIHINKKTV